MPAQRTGTVEEPDWSALYFPYLGAVQAISLHRECNLRVFLETKGVIKGHAEVGDMLLAAVTARGVPILPKPVKPTTASAHHQYLYAIADKTQGIVLPKGFRLISWDDLSQMIWASEVEGAALLACGLPLPVFTGTPSPLANIAYSRSLKVDFDHSLDHFSRCWTRAEIDVVQIASHLADQATPAFKRARTGHAKQREEITSGGMGSLAARTKREMDPGYGEDDNVSMKTVSEWSAEEKEISQLENQLKRKEQDFAVLLHEAEVAKDLAIKSLALIIVSSPLLPILLSRGVNRELRAKVERARARMLVQRQMGQPAGAGVRKNLKRKRD